MTLLILHSTLLSLGNEIWSTFKELLQSKLENLDYCHFIIISFQT